MTTHISDQNMFQRFLHSQVTGSLILIAATIIALVWANSQWGDFYTELSHTYIGVHFGDWNFELSLSHWIKDGLMAIFFFVVGLEIKREIVVGELSSLDRALLPVCAALGGAIVPATIYALVNISGEAAAGWGIPMATDIAFALGILALFGSRVPIGLKVFLTALAIADDLLAVLVIAFFYTDEVSFSALGIAAVFMLLIVAAGWLGYRQTWIYLLLAVGAWAGVFASGVHATVAGVLIAMLVPMRSRIEPNEFFERTRRHWEELGATELTRASPASNKEQMRALDDMYLAIEDMRPAGISLEHQLHPVQSFIILPLFALFMAGVQINADALSRLSSPVSLGIIFGLVAGKQIGIVGATWLAVRSGHTALPEGVTWGQIWGTACLAGVGFTMAIFIDQLAFDSDVLIDQAKVAILLASVTSGVFGYFVLHRVLPKA